MRLKSIRYNLGLLSRKFGVSPGILKQIWHSEEFYKGQPLYHHLVAHLENFGYEMYSMTDISLSDKGKWLAGDAIFVKK